MSSPLFILVYASAANVPFSKAELLTLLKDVRPRNAAVDVTGLLLHHDGNFFQALEGPEAAVRDVFARIQRDPRHHTLITLLEETVPARLFSDWAMGFEQADRLDPAKHPGLSTFLQRPDAYTVTTTVHEDVIIFLRTFQEHLR